MKPVLYMPQRNCGIIRHTADRELDELWSSASALMPTASGRTKAGRRIKELGAGRADLQADQGRASESQADLRSQRSRHPHPRLPVHARLHAEWHIRRRLASILSDEEDQEAARAQRASPVELRCSHRLRLGAMRRVAMRSSFALLADLSTVTLNEVSIGRSENFMLIKASIPGQRKAFDLPGVNPM